MLVLHTAPAEVVALVVQMVLAEPEELDLGQLPPQIWPVEVVEVMEEVLPAAMPLLPRLAPAETILAELAEEQQPVLQGQLAAAALVK